MIVLYTTGCPKCNILKEKLDSKGVEYSICEDIDIMSKENIDKVPVLNVDNSKLDYLDAVKWVNSI